MKKKTAKKNNTDAGELHPPAVRCCSEKMRAQQKRVCSCEIIEWFSCLLPPGVPPHSSTQGDMCLRTWDKFYKRRINVRIRGDGDTCLGVMWDFFFFFFFQRAQGHQSSPSCGDTCCMWNVMRPMHEIPRHRSPQPAFAACVLPARRSASIN